MKKNILAKLSPFHFLMLLIAGIINAIGVTLFIAPVQLYDSGISGTSILLSQLTPDYLSLSFFLILLNIPLLLFPPDYFATRQPDPVLQQLEVPNDLSMSASDCFKPVAKYWDRVSRPEQLMSAMVNAMRVLTDTANCGTAVISLPQDVQGESFDFPDYFFQKRVHHVAAA